LADCFVGFRQTHSCLSQTSFTLSCLNVLLSFRIPQSLSMFAEVKRSKVREMVRIRMSASMGLCVNMIAHFCSCSIICGSPASLMHPRTHVHMCTYFSWPSGLCLDYQSETVPEPNWILLMQETVSGSDISWAVCKSTPRPRQTTMPAPHHSLFTGQMPFLPPNQQHQSTGCALRPPTGTFFLELTRSYFLHSLLNPFQNPGCAHVIIHHFDVSESRYLGYWLTRYILYFLLVGIELI